MSTSLDAMEDAKADRSRTQLNLRVSKTEYEMIAEMARKNGMGVTGFVLWCCGVRKRK